MNKPLNPRQQRPAQPHHNAADADGGGSREDGLANRARRRFLGAVATLAAGLPAGLGLPAGAAARPLGAPASDQVRWGMLIDADQCAKGCTACVDACNDENGLHDVLQGSAATRVHWIRKVELRKQNAPEISHSLPLLCQHCDNPPCVDVCPTGASFKRADGIVLVDRHSCIGCRYCMLACPYNSRAFVHENLTQQKTIAPRGKGCVESCTFCVHRIDSGNYQPACAEACSDQGHQAIAFGDLSDPASPISQALAARAGAQIRADLGTDPGVYYHGIPT